MNAIIQTFINDHIEFIGGAEVLTTAIRDAYAKHTGATKGKLTLYKMLAAIAGVRKDKKAFYGLRLKQEQVETPVVAQPVVPPQEPSNGMTAYEQEMINIKKEKLSLQRECHHEEMELKNKEMEQQINIKRMELDDKDKDRQCMVAEKALDRAFMEKENNKNRVMYVSTHFNRFTDFELYGTPSCQYISDKSMRDVLAFSGYRDGVDITNETIKTIERNIAELAEPIKVVEKDRTKEIKAVSVDHMDKIMAIATTANICPDRLTQKIETARQMAMSDYRYQLNEVDLKLKLQDNSKHRTAKDKRLYVKARNNITFNDGRIIVKCFCCQQEMDLNSSSCHRSHDIAQSKGGDWSDDNIYLCCASCNHDMGDDLTVIEYTARLFNRDILDEDGYSKIE
jgi:5-methylcytosine-specific restriction endonuclease McrA